jgi:tetratricopeptide (TPR) repeat protein
MRDPGAEIGSFDSLEPAAWSPARLSRLEQRLQRLYEDARCRGLLDSVYRPALPKDIEQDGAGQTLPRQLVPLGRVLIELGYHDVALECMELAGAFDPAPEPLFARAYLLALLGDTEDAYRAYVDGSRRFGPIPAEELTALRVLANTHAEEEDLEELYELVKEL